MTNPMFNPQPNYSGVTIQIANPAVNVGECSRNCTYGNNVPQIYGGYIQPANNNGISNPIAGRYNNQIPQNNFISYPQYGLAETGTVGNPQNGNFNNLPNNNEQYRMTNPVQQNIPGAYPAQYYLNNYNYAQIPADNNSTGVNGNDNQRASDDFTTIASRNTDNNVTTGHPYNVTSYKVYADKPKTYDDDLTRSTNIIDDIDERVAEEKKEKNNTKETKIIALTDDYIKSLENYLNNPNDEIRLMASKEVLKRLDEDKDRYNDAALNALLNKMMQDPSKLVRIAALSAFSSQLASGNDYTVKLLQDIQTNPNADKEDVLQAADIMLKMSAGVEMKNIPIPEKKDKNK